ncbi:MAG: tRNA guanosine(34) transglycosylase Tgt [Alphaproteobacteria bacterium]|jgi:queuine tRNA-ribosyltransferase|nr:tRNA guanosine(34) transglycosylase Tgt [Alphaproteobacteria bacterium]MDP6780253.1 tRNA guanosine(34) transglycosylase Tgt [Alphaproteobacteria bacterium]MDP7044292.1 tRNA guanosine(34) transglycosylase Tgt [Alphaproteobacteria bacterium]
MTAPDFGFSLLDVCAGARRGKITTAHGTVDTPAFMPVGTAATVKAMTPQAVRDTGAQMILANTYHLMLRPGAETVAALGGLHKFMNWRRPILTDSGGFQIWSLNELREIDAGGVTFRSHLDGSRHHLTPERAVDIQDMLGADIVMVLDECTDHPATRDRAEESLRLTLDWARRCRDAFPNRPGHGLFGIVQGGMYEDLREEAARALVGIGFHGYAIGGLSVGEDRVTLLAMLEAAVSPLPENQPRYLMGVGRPADILQAVARGVDMFDCVLPTRSGRTSKAFTRRGEVNLRNAHHSQDPRPLDDQCPCPACRDYSRAYLHHLVRSGEILGAMLLTGHNLRFYQDMMAGIRKAVAADTFAAFSAAFLGEIKTGDIPEHS